MASAQRSSSGGVAIRNDQVLFVYTMCALNTTYCIRGAMTTGFGIFKRHSVYKPNESVKCKTYMEYEYILTCLRAPFGRRQSIISLTRNNDIYTFDACAVRALLALTAYCCWCCLLWAGITFWSISVGPKCACAVGRRSGGGGSVGKTMPNQTR